MSAQQLSPIFLLFLRASGSFGGFLRDSYWSSSEESSNLAWRQHFADGYPLNYYKDHRHRVRAVRDF